MARGLFAPATKARRATLALAVVVCFVCTFKRGRLSGGKGRDRVTSAALRGRIPSSLPRPPRNLSGFGEEQRARGPSPPLSRPLFFPSHLVPSGLGGETVPRPPLQPFLPHLSPASAPAGRQTRKWRLDHSLSLPFPLCTRFGSTPLSPPSSPRLSRSPYNSMEKRHRNGQNTYRWTKYVEYCRRCRGQ